MKNARFIQVSILTMFAAAAFTFSKTAFAAEPAPSASPSNSATTQTIDTLIESLEKVPYSPEKVRETLKPLVQSPFKDVVVAFKKIGAGSTIQITFEMNEKKTKLSDVTKTGATWATGPLLPDSGSCPISRDWSWETHQKTPKKAAAKAAKKAVTCSAIAENCESLQTAQIEGEITCFLDRGKKK